MQMTRTSKISIDNTADSGADKNLDLGVKFSVWSDVDCSVDVDSDSTSGVKISSSVDIDCSVPVDHCSVDSLIRES